MSCHVLAHHLFSISIIARGTFSHLLVKLKFCSILSERHSHMKDWTSWQLVSLRFFQNEGFTSVLTDHLFTAQKKKKDFQLKLWLCSNTKWAALQEEISLTPPSCLHYFKELTTMHSGIIISMKDAYSASFLNLIRMKYRNHIAYLLEHT